MLLLGMAIGTSLTLIFLFLSYIIVRQLVFWKGKSIISGIEREIEAMKDAVTDESQIVFPETEKDIFLQEDSTLNDIIRE